MKKVICDKCGREGTDKPISEFNEVTIDLGDNTSISFTKDLCNSCVRRLREWLTNPDPQAN